MIYHIEGGFEVKEGCIQVLVVEGCIFYIVYQIQDLPVGASVSSEAFLS